jgi:hypothetical protein
MDQPAYRLAVQVCSDTADKLQRYVCQYFTDIIVAHPDDEQTQTEDLQTAHNLIQRLNRSCPALLHSVIPQLEEEIRLESLHIRTIATQTLGEMYGDKGAADLVRKYPSTWSAWLSRRNDKSPAVRIQFIETTGGLLTNLPEQREVIEGSHFPLGVRHLVTLSQMRYSKNFSIPMRKYALQCARCFLPLTTKRLCVTCLRKLCVKSAVVSLIKR